MKKIFLIILFISSALLGQNRLVKSTELDTLKVRVDTTNARISRLHTEAKKKINNEHISNTAYINASNLNQNWTIVSSVGHSTVVIDVVNNSCNGVITFEADGTKGVQQIPVYSTLEKKWLNKIRGNGIYKVDISGYQRWRLVTSGISSGTYTVGYRMTPLNSTEFSSNSVVIPTVTNAVAQVVRQTISLSGNYSELVVQNKSTNTPIEFTHDGASTAQRWRLFPGQSTKINVIDKTIIYYWSVFSTAQVSFVYGENLTLPSQGTNNQKFRIETTPRKTKAIRGRKLVHIVNTTAYISNDLGATTTNQYTFPATVDNAYITQAQTILIWSNNTIFRSTNDGAAWTNAQSSGSNIVCMKTYHHHSIDQFGSNIIFAEYGADGNHPDGTGAYRYIWKSTDDGATWAKSLQVAHEASGSDTTKIRHFHTVVYNVNDLKWYATTGDENQNVHWYRSANNGATWSKIFNIGKSQKYRTLNTVFLPDGYCYFAADASTEQGIRKIKVSDLSTTSSTVSLTEELLFPLYGMVYINEFVGGAFVVATRTNDKYSIQQGPPTVYCSKDLGKTWEKILSWPLSSTLLDDGFFQAGGVDADGGVHAYLGDNLIGAHQSPEFIQEIIIYP